MENVTFKQTPFKIKIGEKRLEAMLFEGDDKSFYVIPCLQNKMMNPNLDGEYGERFSPICHVSEWAIRNKELTNPMSVDSSEKEIADGVNTKVEKYLNFYGINREASCFDRRLEETVYNFIIQDRTKAQ